MQKLERASLIAEIVGAVAVVLSVGYLTLEVRRNTAAVESQTSQGLLEMANGRNELIATDVGLADLFLKASRDFEGLTPAERLRYRRWINSGLNIWEHAFYSHAAGTMDDDLWEGYDTSYMSIVCDRPSRAIWKEIASFFGSAFRAHVDGIGPDDCARTSLDVRSSVADASAREPTGLAAAALSDSGFTWVGSEAAGIRAWFPPGSYAHAHRDSLLARLAVALAADRALIGAPPLPGPIDVFFVASREEMAALAGHSVAGFADMASRAVFLVTNPEWRAFERHEIMHVVAASAWGAPAEGTAWLQEGLAQAADGSCGGFPNAVVATWLAERHGWIPLETMLSRFREQGDLRAYLQAAAFTDFLLARAGPESLRDLWRRGATPETDVAGRTLATWERAWRRSLSAPAAVGDRIDRIEAKGCG